MRVVIADDQILFLKMLEEMLEKDEDIQVVGTATNGADVIKRVNEMVVDLVLMDIKMPETSGLVALKELKRQYPDLKIVMLTTFEDENTIIQSCQSGADGYLVKDIKPSILIMALKCICEDVVMIHKSVYELLCHQQRAYKYHPKERVHFGDATLDGVDMQIVKCISEGKTNKEIAMTLNYSEGTIKNRVSRILSLTGLSDRTQISVYAIKHHLI